MAGGPSLPHVSRGAAVYPVVEGCTRQCPGMGTRARVHLRHTLGYTSGIPRFHLGLPSASPRYTSVSPRYTLY